MPGLSVTVWDMEHPAIGIELSTIRVFTCADCGLKWPSRWTIHCSEDGTRLYCRYCEPSGCRWNWCTRHGHVITTGECKKGYVPESSVVHTPTCQRCGQVFTARRSDARYCSGRCRVAAHRANA
jgi:hypothetical protein